MEDLGNKDPPILALPGPQYSFDYSNGVQIGDVRLAITQEGGQVIHSANTNLASYSPPDSSISIPNSVLIAPQGRGTAWAVWDGAVAVALYLDNLIKAQPLWLQNWFGQQDTTPNEQRFTILELGSGTGLAGLAAAAVFKGNIKYLRVVLADLAEALPALERNVVANPCISDLINVTECDWHNPNVENLVKFTENNKIDCIIAADCVWLEELVPPFVATLEEIIKKSGSIRTKVLLGYQSRSQRVDDLLFGLLKKSFTIVAAEKLPGEPERGKIEVSWLEPLPCLFSS